MPTLDDEEGAVYSGITYTLSDHVERLELTEAGGAIDGYGNADTNYLLNIHQGRDTLPAATPTRW